MLTQYDFSFYLVACIGLFVGVAYFGLRKLALKSTESSDPLSDKDINNIAYFLAAGGSVVTEIINFWLFTSTEYAIQLSSESGNLLAVAFTGVVFITMGFIFFLGYFLLFRQFLKHKHME